MIRQRGLEIAIQEGRNQPRQDDLERARRELSGISAEPNDGSDELAAPIPPDEPHGTRGRVALKGSLDDDEVPAMQLLQEGLDEAEHEHMTEAEREARRH